MDEARALVSAHVSVMCTPPQPRTTCCGATSLTDVILGRWMVLHTSCILHYLVDLDTYGGSAKNGYIPVIDNRWFLSLQNKLGSALCIHCLSSIQDEIRLP